MLKARGYILVFNNSGKHLAKKRKRSREVENENDDQPGGSMFTSTTCLLPDNPLNDVIGNMIGFISIFKNYLYNNLYHCLFFSKHI